ncbi:MAG: Brp/Blh family beta-carotene 15,15'-dioxygenase [Saprospiraceae bacterium]|nr:Brp/Blh family beta-carotene 15,15'-dioxygenase [Saprospiraceae bacterium]
MKLDATIKFKFLTIVLAIPLVYVGFQDSIGLFFPILILATLGIPHGATDHLVHQYNEGKALHKTPWSFYTKYLSYIAFFLILWIVTPSITLLAFLGLSAYHFGQTQLAYWTIKNKLARHTAYLSWGAAVLIMIFGFHLNEVAELLAPFELLAPIFNPELQSTYFLLTGLLVLAFNSMLITHRQNKEKWIGPQVLENVEFLVLALVFSQNGLLISFCLFFGFWHSLKAFYTEWSAMKEAHPEVTLGKLAIQAIPYTLISFVGIGLAVWAYTLVNVSFSPLVLIIIMISLISFPHILLFDQFYQKIHKS